MNSQNALNIDSMHRAATTSTLDSAEATLRLIAALPAPQGLAERVQLRLAAEPRTARVLAWPAALRSGSNWMQGGWRSSSALRTAAAAAIVFAIAGGGWGVYSRVQPTSSAKVIVMQPRSNANSGFSSANAIRTPQTANGPVLVKQTASPVLVKPHGKDAAKAAHTGSQVTAVQ